MEKMTKSSSSPQCRYQINHRGLIRDKRVFSCTKDRKCKRKTKCPKTKKCFKARTPIPVELPKEYKKLSQFEFELFIRYFSHIEEDDLDIEYKAYLGFLEFVKPEHVVEFFTYGYMTIGKWRLWHDLEISEAKEKHTPKREILSCTDGNNYMMPYFDQVYQKAIYLYHNPEKIVKLGMRHTEHIPSERIGGPGVRRGMHIRRVRHRVLRPKEIEFKKLVKLKNIIRERAAQRVHIINPPEWAIVLMKIALAGKYTIKILKNGNISIIRSGIGTWGGRSRYHRKTGRHLGINLPIMNVSKFTNFMMAYIREGHRELGLKLTPEDELNLKDLLNLYSQKETLAQRFTKELKKGKIEGEYLKNICKLPISIIIFIESNHKPISFLDILKYYENHSEYRTDLKEEQQDGRE